MTHLLFVFSGFSASGWSEGLSFLASLGFNGAKTGGKAFAKAVKEGSRSNGQAAARGLVLITRNGREFIRVQGLRWEDWETP